MTRRAYASLVLVRVGGLSAQAREPRGAWEAWRESTRYGRPRFRDVLLVIGKWMLPPDMRRRLRARIAGDPRSR
jgi:hypothetical protein